MTTQLSAKVDANYKIGFDNVCRSLGLTSSAVINVFIKRVALYNGLPFDINDNANTPNSETLAAFAETDERLKNGTLRNFSNLSDMWEHMEQENEMEENGEII